MVCAQEAAKKEEEKPKEAAPAAEEKKEAADKPKEEVKPKDGEEEKKEEAPPPPPEEVEMRVYMHCEGCARKVKKILRRLDGNACLPSCWINPVFYCPQTQVVDSWFLARFLFVFLLAF